MWLLKSSLFSSITLIRLWWSLILLHGRQGVKFALSHICRLGCFCIPDTLIFRSSVTPLSGCMNRSTLAPSWMSYLWREPQGFDKGSRLGSRQGCMFFCGLSAYWFPSTVLKHANSLDWSLSRVWNHPITPIIRCGHTQEARPDTNYWLFLSLIVKII